MSKLMHGLLNEASTALTPVCAGCWSGWTCRLKQQVHRPWSQSVLVVGQAGLAGWNSRFTGPGPSLCWLLVRLDLQAEIAGSPALVPVCAGCWSVWTCRLKQWVHRPWSQSVLVVGQCGLAGWNSGFTGPGPSLCWLLVSVDLQAETAGSPALVPVCAGCWSVWTCRLKQQVHRPWSQSVLVVGQAGLAGWNSRFTGPGPSLCWLLVRLDLQAETAGSPALVPVCAGCWSVWTCRLKQWVHRPWSQSVLVVGQCGLAGWNSRFTGPGPSLCWLLVRLDLQAETAGSPALVPVCAGCWSGWTCRLKQQVHRPWSQSVLVVGQAGLAGWNSRFTGPGPSLCWLLVSVDLQAETVGSPALVPVCAGCWSVWTCRLKQQVHRPWSQSVLVVGQCGLAGWNSRFTGPGPSLCWLLVRLDLQAETAGSPALVPVCAGCWSGWTCRLKQQVHRPWSQSVLVVGQAGLAGWNSGFTSPAG